MASAPDFVPTWAITVAEIQRRVCARFDLEPLELLSHRRGATARPRQIAMYLAKTLTPRSYPEIGRLLRRDHSTVMHGVRRIEALRASDPGIDAAVRALAAELTGAAATDPDQLTLPIAGA